MFDLIKLRYTLNREYFYSASILFKDIPETPKKIFFAIYSILKVIFLMLICISIQLLIIKNQFKLYIFDIFHLVLFLVCTLYFANNLEAENSKTHIKDFLMGTNFNNVEKVINKQKISCIYFFESCFFYVLNWSILLPVIKQLPLINILVAFFLSIVTVVNVYYQNYNSKKENGSKYWILNYLLMGVITFGIIQFWRIFKIKINFSDYEGQKNNLLMMIFGLIYQIITIIFSFKKEKGQNQNLTGILGDFIEKYLNNSAALYFAPIIFFNIVTISRISMVLFIVSYISFFVMPNVVSLNFLNYYKMVGNSSKILFNYGKRILLFQFLLSAIMGILSGIDLISLFLVLILLSVVTALRILVAIWVVNSTHEDAHKTDYYAVSMFAPVILLIMLAFFWR